MDSQEMTQSEHWERVIVDGRYLCNGHSLAWRRGWAHYYTDGTCHAPDVNTVLVDVTLETRGRERNLRTTELPLHWLLPQSQELINRLQSHGLLKGHDNAHI